MDDEDGYFGERVAASYDDSAAEMFELLKRLNTEGKTILYVTHDLELAARAHRVITIRDGRIVAG